MNSKDAEVHINAQKLRDFAIAMFEAADWPDGGNIDGFTFQEAAVACGLLIPEERAEPCGENCRCAEYNGTDGFPVTCYRKAEWLLAKSKEQA